MLKKIIPWLFAVTVVMVLFPFLAVRFGNSDSGMMVSMFLLLILNPISFFATGIFAGQQAHRLWSLPFLLDILFAISFGIILQMDVLSMCMYIGIYTAVAFLSMTVTVVIKHKNQ